MLLRAVPRLDALFRSPLFHLVVVSAIAACALQVALFATLAAGRLRHPAVSLLALGSLCVGAFMLGHGLTTPGVGGRPANVWVARLPLLAIAGFAICLGIATFGERNPVLRLVSRHPRASLVGPGLVIVAVLAVTVVRPTAWFGTRQLAGEPLVRHLIIAIGSVSLFVTGLVHWRRWRLGGDRIQLALVLSCWLSAQALGSLEFGHLWRVSWWDYHAFLLAGFAAAVYAIVVNLRRTRRIEDVLKVVFLDDPLEHIAHSYPEALHALVAAVEAKDGYTRGHSARVAEMSVRIGQRMGLGADELRHMAQGALLHDIGKIGVPDHILSKPGPLTPDERAWIERHPIIGWEIVRCAPSLHEALAIVRHHHERIDGRGYPDGLSGRDISLDARIAAVADVWDALTSDRSYRPAWSTSQALAHIAAGRGAHFDAACVDSFMELMAQRGLRPHSRGGDAEVARAAASECHRAV
jgi:HD-GYP domain-containing protein (c-di-GMP phosphodiesterase class II)